jgi:hypothetical protein
MASGRTRVLLIVGSTVVAAALFVGGRLSAAPGGSRGGDGAASEGAGYSSGYTAGLKDGQAEGLADGRALQVPLALPGGVQDVAKTAFVAGYAAGANDVFDGYDGGWRTNSVYAIVLEPGRGGITYRIASRLGLSPGTNYYLCPSSTVCSESRK